MSKILVFGHQSPDTDAITSAISFSYLQNKLGKNTEAVAFGQPTEETQYALDYFKTEAPRVVTSVSTEVKEVMLVDHNEAQQSAPDINKVSVLSVVDHHRIANFQTTDPLYYRAEPVGCTQTIIWKLFKENNIKIPQNIAGLMLSAIISDTLLLQSPTTTSEDEDAAKALAELAEVDLAAYGKDLLKAGTNTANKTAYQILNDDAKNFPMGEATVRIGQVNVVDVDEVLARKMELLKEMEAQSLSSSYDLFLLVITNVLENNSVSLVFGSEKEKVSEAFDKEIIEDTVLLNGVVSRKKQVVPQLTEAFTK